MIALSLQFSLYDSCRAHGTGCRRQAGMVSSENAIFSQVEPLPIQFAKIRHSLGVHVSIELSQFRISARGRAVKLTVKNVVESGLACIGRNGTARQPLNQR